MSLETVLSKLSEEERAEVTAAIQAEANKGIEASRKKGAENTKLIAENARLKDTIKSTLGVEFSSDADLGEVLKGKITELTAGKVDQSEVGKLSKQIEAITRSLEAERTEKIKAQENMRVSKISNVLLDKMKGKVAAHDFVIKDLISSGRVKQNDDESIVFFGKDGLEYDIDKGIESFRKERPDVFINQQNGGSGGSSTTGTSGNVKTISLKSFNDLGSTEKAAYMVLVADGKAKVTETQ
jgi:hypothetical protein